MTSSEGNRNFCGASCRQEELEDLGQSTTMAWMMICKKTYGLLYGSDRSSFYKILRELMEAAEAPGTSARAISGVPRSLGKRKSLPMVGCHGHGELKRRQVSFKLL